MAKCERHLWDDLDKEPCWRCDELKYKKSNIMAKEQCVSCGAETAYDFTYSSALRKDNFYGVQFHPEKSGTIGAQVLSNFLKL